MGTEYPPVANLPSDEEDDTQLPDDEPDDERSLADIVHGGSPGSTPIRSL